MQEKCEITQISHIEVQNNILMDNYSKIADGERTICKNLEIGQDCHVINIKLVKVQLDVTMKENSSITKVQNMKCTGLIMMGSNYLEIGTLHIQKDLVIDVANNVKLGKIVCMNFKAMRNVKISVENIECSKNVEFHEGCNVETKYINCSDLLISDNCRIHRVENIDIGGSFQMAKTSQIIFNRTGTGINSVYGGIDNIESLCPRNCESMFKFDHRQSTFHVIDYSIPSDGGQYVMNKTMILEKGHRINIKASEANRYIKLELIIRGDLVMKAGSAISVNGGAGYGQGCKDSSAGCSHATHGGSIMRKSYGPDYMAGKVYGEKTLSKEIHFGCGHTPSSFGGGILILKIEGALKMEECSALLARGTSSPIKSPVGGGSGGSILIICNDIKMCKYSGRYAVTSDTRISAQGGSGYSQSFSWNNTGKGGDGRIAIYCKEREAIKNLDVTLIKPAPYIEKDMKRIVELCSF